MQTQRAVRLLDLVDLGADEISLPQKETHVPGILCRPQSLGASRKMDTAQRQASVLGALVDRDIPSRNADGRDPSHHQVANVPPVHRQTIGYHRDEFVDAMDDTADARNESVGLSSSVVFDKSPVTSQESLVVIAVVVGFGVGGRGRDDLARNHQMGCGGSCGCHFELC